MENATHETSPKPILHRFLLSDGTFIIPAEMEIMESLGGCSNNKELNSMNKPEKDT